MDYKDRTIRALRTANGGIPNAADVVNSFGAENARMAQMPIDAAAEADARVKAQTMEDAQNPDAALARKAGGNDLTTEQIITQLLEKDRMNKAAGYENSPEAKAAAQQQMIQRSMQVGQ